MMKATAPMIGGVICPPLDAAASTAPAKCDFKPLFLIKGIVITPVPTTLATALPEIVPNNPLAIVASIVIFVVSIVISRIIKKRQAVT